MNDRFFGLESQDDENGIPPNEEADAERVTGDDAIDSDYDQDDVHIVERDSGELEEEKAYMESLEEDDDSFESQDDNFGGKKAPPFGSEDDEDDSDEDDDDEYSSEAFTVYLEDNHTSNEGYTTPDVMGRGITGKTPKEALDNILKLKDDKLKDKMDKFNKKKVPKKKSKGWRLIKDGGEFDDHPKKDRMNKQNSMARVKNTNVGIIHAMAKSQYNKIQTIDLKVHGVPARAYLAQPGLILDRLRGMRKEWVVMTISTAFVNDEKNKFTQYSIYINNGIFGNRKGKASTESIEDDENGIPPNEEADAERVTGDDAIDSDYDQDDVHIVERDEFDEAEESAHMESLEDDDSDDEDSDDEDSDDDSDDEDSDDEDSDDDSDDDDSDDEDSDDDSDDEDSDDDDSDDEDSDDDFEKEEDDAYEEDDDDDEVSMEEYDEDLEDEDC